VTTTGEATSTGKSTVPVAKSEEAIVTPNESGTPVRKRGSSVKAAPHKEPVSQAETAESVAKAAPANRRTPRKPTATKVGATSAAKPSPEKQPVKRTRQRAAAAPKPAEDKAPDQAGK